MEVDSAVIKEILPHIFKFLSLPDRKCVRLTCKVWNNACSHPTIIQREKFVFRPENNDLIPFLSHCVYRCKNTRPHFEFQGLSLRQLQSNWWKICGDRLISLVLYNCDVSSKTLESVILCCFNLRTLNIRSCVQRTYPDNLLDRFIAHKIKRPNLISLNLYAIDVSNEWYRKLFLICTNIQTLSVEQVKTRGMVLPVKLDNFTYWTKSNCLWMVPLCRNPTTKFKTLDISLDLLVGAVRNMNIVMDFFSNQFDLEKIELAIFADNNRTRELKTLLFYLLKRMPKLKEFAIRGADIHFSIAEFNEFLYRIGHLESFEFFGTLYTPWPVEILMPLPTSASHRMTKLQLPFYQEGLRSDHAEQICLSIMSQCYSLQYLSLGFITKRILMQIFEVHTELRALYLNFCDKIDTSRCLESIDRNPIDLKLRCTASQLMNLSHLQICGLINLDIFEALIAESKFPNLKCFHFTARIEDWEPTERTSFGHRLLAIISASHVPYLECLELHFGISNTYHVKLSMDEVKHCCRKLKNLRFLLIDSILETNRRNGFYEELKQLLIECPSLNYIIHGQNTLAYDRFSGQLKMYPSIFLKMPCCKPTNFH